MLCFDPTRGIDIGTKQQIYELVRELAAAGAAVLFYTSELKEIQLACDRAIVIFGGRIVAEIPVDEADEPTLPAGRLRPAAGRPDARGGRRRASWSPRAKAAAVRRPRRARRRDAIGETGSTGAGPAVSA